METLNLPRKWKPHIQIKTPIEHMGRRNRAEIGFVSLQRLTLVFLWRVRYGLNRPWLLEDWLEWSMIHSGDRCGEEET